MKKNRSGLIAWILAALSLLGASTNLGIYLVQAEQRPPFFEWVEALGWMLVIPIVFSILALLVIIRQPGNRVGWLMMIAALAGASPISTYIDHFIAPPAAISPGLWLLLWLEGWSWIPLIFPIFLIPLHFPTGHPPSSRWNWVNRLAVGMWLFFVLLIPFFTTMGPLSEAWVLPNPIGFIPVDSFDGSIGIFWGFGLVTMVTASVISLFMRYRRAQSTERQQIKWLLYAGSLFAANYAFTFFFATLDYFWVNLWFMVSLLSIPVAIAVAILRYRLYDIDLIIRRTLQYAILTGLLTLVYFGGVTLLQALLTAVGGQPSPVIIVLTTLAIAALFTPLRRRIQDSIDRRFYRQKYDAEQALAEFAAVARSETDLEQLSGRLTGTVQEALQPEQVSLWIQPHQRSNREGL